ncbi:hypothetical protein [Microbacterium sp. P5_E9]
MVSVNFAAASALLIEILVEMTHPTRLVKLRDLVGAPSGTGGAAKLAMLDRAVSIVGARDSGASPQRQLRVLTADEADAEVRDSQVLLLFLHEIAEPNGLVALARVLHNDYPGPGASDDVASIRSTLYLTLLQYRMFAQSVPPVPPGLVAQLS